MCYGVLLGRITGANTAGGLLPDSTVMEYQHSMRFVLLAHFLILCGDEVVAPTQVARTVDHGGTGGPVSKISGSHLH